ncbi:MAG TPA: hypothetical protein VIH46_01760 [Candidatus Acidoferrales bacterium]
MASMLQTGSHWEGISMRTPLFRGILPNLILVFLVFSNVGFADTPTTSANTIEIQQGPLIGHRIGGMTIMNAPCVYGDHFHFEINSEGELRVYGPIICGNLKGGGGGEQVCYLDPQLSCLGRPSLSVGAGTPYAITETGVKVGNEVYPWVNAQQATAVFASIQSKAKRKCDETLFWQSLDKKNNRVNSPPDRVQSQESCKLTLQEICASAHGAPARTGAGKDISVLCQR